MGPHSLTREQRRAAATRAECAYVEAAPGSGKTTVAAERYGVLRYEGSTDGRGVLGLSFARSARSELEKRIRRRWGTEALRWPHKVWTLDTLHRVIVDYLLHTGAIEWPGGHTELTVVDTWRGYSGSRPLTAEHRYCRVATLEGRRVASEGRRIGRPIHGFGNREPHDRLLASGLCTHDEVRQVLAAVLARRDLQPTVGEYLAASTKSIIVDEVFDGNVVDLRIVYLAAQAGIPITLIGDPWQALYDFRGAQPELVPQLLEELSFGTYPVSESFRFQTPDMKELGSLLRDSEPVTLPDGDVVDTDVVLASQWEPLWHVSDHVLPLSFGQIGNQSDAAISLLLDRLVSSHFGQLSTFGLDAAIVLGIDPEIPRVEGDAAFGPVYDKLAGGTQADAEAALAQLRQLVRDMGSPKRLPRLSVQHEAKRVARLQALGRRLGKVSLVPGLTIHQAKGREWPYVGVHLTDTQQARIKQGLNQNNVEDRKLYVAMTRARRQVTRTQK